MYLLQHLLSHTAARLPGKEALRFKDRSLSYAELEAQSNRLCRLLVSQGVGSGDRVGILLNKSPEAVVSLFGILKAGAVYVPLDPAAPPARIASIIGHCGMRAAIASRDLLQRVAAEAEAATLERAVLVAASPAPSPLPGTGIDCVDWDSLKDHSADPPASPGGSDAAPAYILHTSGSTGSPKGVVISHLNALTFVGMACAYFDIGSGDRMANHAPLHFDLSVFDIFCAVQAGGTVVLIPEALSAFPVRLAELMRQEGITVWNSVASVLTKLADQGALERLTLPDLRLVHFSGDLMPVKYLRRLKEFMPAAEFYNIYGQTEANSSLCFRVPEEIADEAWKIPIGKPFPNFEVFALDEKGEVISRAGEEGELHVLSATVALGYWNDLDRTRAQFCADPRTPSSHARVYRTGDLVRLDDAGNFIFAGRRDHMVKSKGFRVELDEIEIVLTSHPRVRQAAAVAIPDDLTGSRIVACLSLTDGPDLPAGELEGLCGRHLPKYMVPERFVFRKTLPTTSNSKIDRKTLLRELLDEQQP